MPTEARFLDATSEELEKTRKFRRDEGRRPSRVERVLGVADYPDLETDVEGYLLGFLFGSVRPSHHQLIVLELTIPLAQLADDLPLKIVLQSDESRVPHVLTRTLAPYPQWSACLEEPGNDCNLPSWLDYLNPREIIDPAYFRDRTTTEYEAIAEEEEEEEEGDEEETPEEGSYSEHNEGEQSEEEEEEQDDQEELEASEWEGFEEEVSVEELKRTEAEQAEDPEAARKREEIVARKRQLEFASEVNPLTTNDPARDPEPPKPEDGDPTAETLTAPTRRRRSRSPYPSTTDRPPV
ncbi:hypothetical protein CBR_g38220 [Chara braunii]|uniref:Uncharacterized protein n=1 Tax=Chara braunii TaxID=69332 RepID=A0A388LPR3_CHABU|nr:hypothetical protein CBR_g38220 [Chara braunii]|eukprot:GBG84249.1 hypothetical protein CBR_g38220 [Chara braunii]